MQVFGGKMGVDKRIFFCGCVCMQIVELSKGRRIFLFVRLVRAVRTGPCRVEEKIVIPKITEVIHKKNNCTLIFTVVSVLFALKEAVFPSVSGSIGGAFVRRKSGCLCRVQKVLARKSGGRGGVRFVCRESACGLAAILKTRGSIAPAIVARTGFCMHRRFVFALRCMLALSQEGRHLLRRKAADTPLRRGADRQPSEKMAGFACWAGRYML